MLNPTRNQRKIRKLQSIMAKPPKKDSKLKLPQAHDWRTTDADHTCPKLPEIETLLDECGENDAKVIVFSEWERMLQLVRDVDRQRGKPTYPPCRISANSS